MNIKTFILIALLIILAGSVHYLSSPKYTFDSKGEIRKNSFTGEVEEWFTIPKKDSFISEWRKRVPEIRRLKLSDLG